MFINADFFHRFDEKAARTNVIIHRLSTSILVFFIMYSGSMEINDPANLSGAVHRGNLESAEVKRASSASSEDSTAIPLGPTAKKTSPRLDR